MILRPLVASLAILLLYFPPTMHAFLARPSMPFQVASLLAVLRANYVPKTSRRFLSRDGKQTAGSTTLAPGLHKAEMELKKSRFIGYAQHAETWKEAQDFLDVVRAEHPKSRHIAYGFVAGCNPVQERCSDDGEPTGTAGLPALGGIKGEELSDVVCAVVRYFGGIKLGAGGLIRAYGGAARLVLREAPRETLIPKTSIRICLPSSNAGSAYDAVAKVGGVASEEEYTAEGDFVVTLTCELEKETYLRESLTDATRGCVQFLDDNV